MTNSIDDTQPRSPFDTPPHGQPPLILPDEEDTSSGGPGCLTWSIIGSVGVGFALVIVLLAGAAGWTSGQRQAQQLATATQQAEIQDQLGRIPGDVSSGNTVLLAARLEFLATQTPGVAGLPELVQTATALYNDSLPTTTPSPTVTPEAATEIATEAPEFEPTIQSSNGGYDLAALLEQAQSALRLGQYAEAVDLLKVIEAVDPTYEAATVRGYMLEALSTQALRLFRGDGNLAEAILLTDEAEQYGLSAESELRFESYVAALYLNARSKIGTSYPEAIQALSEAYRVAPQYRNGELRNLLFSQYVAYGDAWAVEGNHCAAVGQYQNALNLRNDGGVSAKRDSSQTFCEQGTPVPLPGSEGVAPVGVPATPSN